MCGDPLPLFDEDRRLRVSPASDAASAYGAGAGGTSVGTAGLGPLDH